MLGGRGRERGSRCVVGWEVREQVRGRCAPQVPLNADRGFRRGQQRLRARDVVLEVIQEILVRIVRQHDVLRAEHSGHDTGQAGAGAELEDGFAAGEGVGVVLEVFGEDLSGVPEEMALRGGEAVRRGIWKGGKGGRGVRAGGLGRDCTHKGLKPTRRRRRIWPVRRV